MILHKRLNAKIKLRVILYLNKILNYVLFISALLILNWVVRVLLSRCQNRCSLLAMPDGSRL